MHNVDGVGEGDGLEDGAEVVEAVRAFVEHAEVQVDFGEGTDPDVGGHWGTRIVAGGV